MSGAYPRAGGGTADSRPLSIRASGLSPRRRGNPHGRRHGDGAQGPIPAQAGEPVGAGARRHQGLAYPRAGGGTVASTEGTPRGKGLSPRRRGNHRAREPCRNDQGPIPAQAGEPGPADGGRLACEAYPRAGGGTRAVNSKWVRRLGLSPRRRGNPCTARPWPSARGPIPAQAGEPRSTRRAGRSPWAYPRAGGGTDSYADADRGAWGLSPRRRGNHALVGPSV